ncbi:enoyl-ACP reductase FabI [Naumannella halotolerans]|uniref:Enoyl-[acyl-carrier-protein] reductase [NADH] n=1 Tax=Naumannella halotolerans TaxID=993414 RepID=A0A4R7J8R6_9ACTN|nr:enoyl-ACP reductase FabI [Naumannella halotolerans]TDT32883.1 enoyl-[acyl-carrier protein] reductase I [Naumannella halotolerans]
MGILEGKQILVTGVTKHTSIAYEAARIAQAEGATVVVSNFGRALRLTQRVVGRLDPVPPVIELDVTNEEHLAALPERLGEHLDRVDGIVHSIAFANPETALGGKFMDTPWDDVATAVKISAWSMASLTKACVPMLSDRSSVVGLTFDATLAWPMYDWMGVAKAALESVNRYLAKYLGPDGVRSNLVAAGPLDTLAKQSIPGAEEFNNIWAERAPLGWNTTDMVPAAKAVVALLSDWFPATTGEIVHVDGGLHAVGA